MLEAFYLFAVLFILLTPIILAWLAWWMHQQATRKRGDVLFVQPDGSEQWASSEEGEG